MSGVARQILSGLIVVVILIGAQPVVAQQASEHVVLVRMGAGKKQTGFKLQGKTGFVTALHGIVGEDKVTVTTKNGTVLRNLKIAEVDIGNDLAVIRANGNVDLQNPERGLSSFNGKVVGGANLTCVGFPLTTWNTALDTQVRVRNVPMFQLSNLIPPNQLPAFNERNSPSPNSIVLNVDGELLPGHSGGPIVDANGRVVAVADGGLKGSEITWGMLLANARWQNAQLPAVRQQLAGLLNQNVQGLFVAAQAKVEIVAITCVNRDDSFNEDEIYLENNGATVTRTSHTMKDSGHRVELLPSPASVDFDRNGNATITLREKESAKPSDDNLGSFVANVNQFDGQKHVGRIKGSGTFTKWEYEIEYYVR